ncbi:MAG: hypothetical protein ACYTGX_07985, partial [Planctomycetota bacterium]
LAKRRRLEGEKLALLGLGLILGLPYFRNLTILALCSLPLAADGIRLAMAGSRGRVKQQWRYALFAAPVALLWSSLALAGWNPACDYGMRVPGFTWREGNYPIAAADWIAQNAPDAKLWNDLTSGGWYAWRLGEGHTSIDGNTDGYPLEWLKSYGMQRAAHLGVIAKDRPGESLFVDRVDRRGGRLAVAKEGLRTGLKNVAFYDRQFAVFSEPPTDEFVQRAASLRLGRDMGGWQVGLADREDGAPWPAALEAAIRRGMTAAERIRTLGPGVASQSDKFVIYESIFWRERVEAAVIVYPESPSMWGLLAEARTIDADFSGAAEAWKKAIELPGGLAPRRSRPLKPCGDAHGSSAGGLLQ